MDTHLSNHPGSKKALIYAAIIAVALAILALITPAVTSIAVEVLVGILVLLAGFVRFYWAFQAANFVNGAYLFGLGLITVIAGIAMLSNPFFAGGSLTMIVTLYLIIDGIAEVLIGRLLRPHRGWQWMAGAGIGSILLGLSLWVQMPFSGAWAITLCLALKLLLIASIILRTRVHHH